MGCWIVELIWKSRSDRVSPVTSVRMEGVVAPDAEAAKVVVQNLLKGNWKILSVKAQGATL